MKILAPPLGKEGQFLQERETVGSGRGQGIGVGGNVYEHLAFVGG